MSTRRLDRVNELLKREIAEDLYRICDRDGLDLAAITVTQVITSSDLHHARVRVSIRGHEHERGRILRLLEKNRRAIHQRMRSHIRLKYLPQLSFELDESIEKGDHVLSIISRLEAAEAAAEKDHDADEPQS